MKTFKLKQLILVLSISSTTLVYAGTITTPNAYDSGSLNFSSYSQSIWGAGNSYSKNGSVFVGTQWNNKSATIEQFVGDESTQLTPAIPRVQLTPYIPRQQLTPYIPAQYSPRVPAVKSSIYEPRVWVPNPSWKNPLRGYWKGCGCTKEITITPAIPRKKISPAVPATYSPAVPATYSPYIPATYADTRTGISFDMNSSGKVGLEFGYAIDSGSIDTEVNFSAIADLPSNFLERDEFFSINSSSLFEEGIFETQSPQLEAYFSTILELAGSVNIEACGAIVGCASGNLNIPDVNINQRVLSIEPGSLKILDGIRSNGDALAEVPILNQALTLRGGTTVTPPAAGYKLSGPGGTTLLNTLPPTPAFEVDLAKIKLNIPDIEANGIQVGNHIEASGRDDLLSAQIDIDGVASMLGSLPPTGVRTTVIDSPNIKIDAVLDVIDVDVGPVLGLQQDFELIPTLMTTLSFSNPLRINGMNGLQTSWTGRWDELPEFALNDTTTFTPTFWIDSMLRSKLGLDLGLIGSLDFLKLGASGKIAGKSLIDFKLGSINSLFGFDNSLFDTSKMNFSILDNTFRLGGFNQIQGQAFTLAVAGGSIEVPEPKSFVLLLSALVFMMFYSRKVKSNV